MYLRAGLGSVGLGAGQDASLATPCLRPSPPQPTPRKSPHRFPCPFRRVLPGGTVSVPIVVCQGRGEGELCKRVRNRRL